MKKTNQSADGTSFHGSTVITTINRLTNALGHAHYFQNTGEDKVNVEWICENAVGEVVTIYDWKEGRRLGLDEEVEFHLGGDNKMATLIGREELLTLLSKQANEYVS
jgi:hypothetical protein